MMKRLRIQSKDLPQWLASILSAGLRVVAPVREGDRSNFKEITRSDEVDMEGQTTVLSAKATVFPRAEELFRYRREGGDTTLQEPEMDYPQTVLWKARPCDAFAMMPLSGIFNWDYKDKLFNARRERLAIVTFACTTADAYCFCTSVGGGPGNTQGSDIQVTLMGEEALVEVLTPQGEKLIALSEELFFAVSEDELPKEKALADLPQRFTREDIRERIKEAFDSPVWKQQSERCLGCGACAFVCPTCACFDIQEDKHGQSGRRIRCWDSCGFALFTQHTSGHNPRPTQATRWRQRILHKFSYMPDRLDEYGCTGCGRCSRACPVDMNLAEHLNSIATTHHE